MIKLLGSGGFGEAYDVYDKRDAKNKVLKLVQPEKVRKDERILEFFKREADFLCQQVEHPGIPFVEAEKDGYFTWKLSEDSEELYCLVMEKIDGVDLRNEMIQRHYQPILQETALNWMEQLAKIIQVVHQHNFFHRDIKPENIMIRNHTNKIVLIDFGIAREISETCLEKQKDGRGITNAGTPGYRAPEVIRGEGCLQSDFFSLGRTFVFLVTGQDIGKFKQDELGNLDWRSQAIHISDALKDLIDWLMAREPQKRPNNAQILLEKIEHCRHSDQSAPTLIPDDSVEVHEIVINRTAKVLRKIGIAYFKIMRYT